MAFVSVAEAIRLLREGQPVALPTETVYGLAAPIDQPEALERIFTIKSRPFFDPLIVHVLEEDQARQLTQNWSHAHARLAQVFWPGPLTLIAERHVSLVSELITAGQKTVGLRAPSHPLFQEVLRKLKVPLAAPSANRFGKTSPTQAEHVLHEFGQDFPVVDGGPSSVGIESTILSLIQNGNEVSLDLLRPGAISENEILTVLHQAGLSCCWAKHSLGVQPGELKHHYQPDIPLFLIQDDEAESQLKAKYPQGLVELRLPQDPTLAARKLYSELRRLSRSEAAQALYFRISATHKTKSWSAIMNRLQRAAQTNPA